MRGGRARCLHDLRLIRSLFGLTETAFSRVRPGGTVGQSAVASPARRDPALSRPSAVRPHDRSDIPPARDA
jgi:hypothetical protein